MLLASETKTSVNERPRIHQQEFRRKEKIS